MKRKYPPKSNLNFQMPDAWRKNPLPEIPKNKRPFADLFNEPLIAMPNQTTYESPKDHYRLSRISAFPNDESVLQESCVEWFDEYCEAMGLDVVLNHTYNQVGGFRGRNAKRAGYHKGFPDLSIFHVKKKVRIHKDLFNESETREETVLYAGLFVELKTPKTKNDLSDQQKATHETLRKSGYKVETIWDYETFKQTVISYLNDN